MAQVVKNLPANAGDIRDRGSMPGLRREGLEEGTATHSCVLFFFFFPLLYSCLKNFMDRRTWQATAHGVGKSWIQLKHLSTCACTSLRPCLQIGNLRDTF